MFAARGREMTCDRTMNRQRDSLPRNFSLYEETEPLIRNHSILLNWLKNGNPIIRLSVQAYMTRVRRWLYLPEQYCKNSKRVGLHTGAMA